MSEQIKVFFSYGHDRHGEVVKRLAQAIERLSENRIDVWIDHKSIPRDSHWRKEIQEGIYNCNSVLAFLSEYSARDKGVCLDEIAIALVSKHGMIRTILLEPADSFTPPTMVSEYQWGDMSDYPEVLQKGEEAFSAYIDSQAMQIIKLVSSDEIMQYSAEIKELRRRLAMPERDRMTRFDLLLQKEMTERPWLDNIIKQWIEDKNGSKILMLYGKPGAGKSTYCANLQHYNPRVVASISCDHQSNSFSDTDDIIRYLAYKLALRLPDYRSGLIRLLSDDSFTMKSGKDLFDDLIGQPLGKISIDGHRDSMIICIDALDESKTDELAGFLAEYQAYMRDWVRFLITARKEPNIVSRFESFRAIDLDEYNDQTRADMVAYFHRRLDEKLSDFENRDEFISRLTESSENVFTYAECICDNIIEDIDLGKVKELTLYPVPKGIQSLFTNTLDRKFNSTGATYTLRDYEDFWQEPLGMIIASETPLPIATLKQLMGWRNNQLRKFRSPLSTLLTESDGCLQTFHRSFAEWLDKEGTPYYSSIEDGASTLAELCFEQYETDIESLDEYMLLNLTKLLRKTKMKKEYERVTGDKDFIERIFDTEEKYYDKNLLYKAMTYCDELIAIFKDFTTEDVYGAYSLVRAYSRKGDILKTICHYDEAMRYFETCLELCEKIVEKYPENSECLLRYSLSFDKVAGIYEDRNRLDEALTLYKEAMLVGKKSIEVYPENPECLRRYSISLERIAGIYDKQCKLEEALLLYREKSAITEKLAETYPDNPTYLRSYRISIEKIAGIYEKHNKLEDALSLYSKALDISKKLAEAYSEKPLYLRDYSICLEKVAGIYEVQNRLEEALSLYDEEIAIDRRLTEEYPENPVYLQGYSSSLDRVAGIYEVQNRLEEALSLYNEELAVDRRLAEAYPENPECLWGYAISLERVANIYRKQNRIEEAVRLFREETAIYEKLTEAYPENPDYLQGYSISIDKIADIYRVQKRYDEAMELYIKELAIDRRLSELYPENPTYLRGYSVSLINIADIYKAQNKLEEALSLYNEALAIRKKLSDSYPENPTYLFGYSVSLEEVADVYKTQNKLEEAFSLYNEALAIWKKLSGLYPENLTYLRGYSVLLEKTADVCKAQHNIGTALKLYGEASAIKKKLNLL
ncbi:MAG: tetratricopeptide repeat protein [Ruminiclostridium sp.]|nr:tetratricopeptide repeat protein [Ruminiclostridium sp.]